MNKPLLLAAAVVCGLSAHAGAATFAYISSPGDGLISQYRLDESNGALSLVDQVTAGDQVIVEGLQKVKEGAPAKGVTAEQAAAAKAAQAKPAPTQGKAE